MLNKLNKSVDDFKNFQFPHAPENWTPENAQTMANEDGLYLGDDHWELLTSLQEYYSKQENVGANIRELHDALEEKFHSRGGMKYLYKLFPEGPVAQGGRIAGLEVPSVARDLSFGSVQ